MHFMKVEKSVIDTFKNRIFPLLPIEGAAPNWLTPKQILQRLPVALPEIKATNTSENLLNEICRLLKKYIAI